MPQEEFDVCVIGTGAGGGVMLQELTTAGFKVIALERGPKLDVMDFMSDDELSFRSVRSSFLQGNWSRGDPMPRAPHNKGSSTTWLTVWVERSLTGEPLALLCAADTRDKNIYSICRYH
jgi:choline dehydrogenase-like flavoprotein